MTDPDTPADTSSPVETMRVDLDIDPQLIDIIEASPPPETDVLESVSLHVAASRGNYDLVRVLLDRGINIDAQDSRGFTALHLAAMYGHEYTAALLLLRHADVNPKDRWGYTPLHAAGVAGEWRTVRVLVQYGGADIEATENTGKTPLHIAVAGGDPEDGGSLEAVIELLANGASQDAVDSSGKTPAQLVRGLWAKQMSAILKNSRGR